MLSTQELIDFKGDSDWRCAFSEAVNGEYVSSWDREETGKPHPIDNVVEVHYCDEGENDGLDWIAIGKWSDGQFFLMAAGCDYTGWD